MPDLVKERTNVKHVLEAARLEIANAIQRIDGANATDLAVLRGAAHTLAAFVDINGSCAASAEKTSELFKRLHG